MPTIVNFLLLLSYYAQSKESNSKMTTFSPFLLVLAVLHTATAVQDPSSELLSLLKEAMTAHNITGLSVGVVVNGSVVLNQGLGTTGWLVRSVRPLSPHFTAERSE